MFSAGCTTSQNYYLPGSSGQIPEVSGRLWGGSAEAHLASGVAVQIVRDLRTTPPATDMTSANSSVFLSGTSFLFDLGLADRFDIYVRRGVGARFQVYGVPGEEGWKSTVFVQQANTSTKTTDGTIGSSDNDPKVDAQTISNAIEVGTSIGYSPKVNQLLFVTLLYGKGLAKTTVNHPSAGQWKVDDQFTNIMLSLGARIGDPWFFQYEISGTYVDWPRIAPTVVGAGNLGFGYQW